VMTLLADPPLSGASPLPHLDLIKFEILLGLAAPPDQIVGGNPVNQAFLTFCVKRQLVVAVQHARGGNVLFEAINLVGTTEAYIHLTAGPGWRSAS